MRAAITNVALGELIDLSHATVSRIRSGDRLPSVEVMAKIKDELGWSLDDQVSARLARRYVERFEEILVRRYGVAEDVATPA